MSQERAYLADALHAPVRGEIALLRAVLIVVGEDGVIRSVHRGEAADTAALAQRFRAAGTLETFADGQYLLPGLVDLHVHAPQWPQLGMALDLPLEEWLQKYTFPLEARYADVEFARTAYRALVSTLLANGTTTAVYYATIHLEATQVLADICLAAGQRALIGRVAMDDGAQCPAFYRDASPQAALADTRAFISYVRDMAGNEAGTILPVITPRFIPSCSDELLAALGSLASESGCHVQTHCSESDWEHAYVLERCGVSDTQALEGFGLLSRRTVLAHGNFIGEADAARIVRAGAGIAHCPLSNVYFSDAIFPLRRMLERGMHVGLGTDIAGGASPSILENARQAVIASRTLEAGVDAALPREARRSPHSRIDAATALWLATVGGGEVLDLPLGLFREGYQFDAMLIAGGANLRMSAVSSAQEILQKVVYHCAPANIDKVWVRGTQVHGSGLPASPLARR